MSAGKCQTCGNEYKNLGAHRCKAKKQEDTPVVTEDIHIETIIGTPTIEPAMTQESSPIPEKETTSSTESIVEPKTSPWYKRLLSKKQPKEKRKVTVNEMLDNLPRWSIKQRKPWSSPKNKNATWIQFVAFSRTRAPKAVWVEYDGVNISVDGMFFPTPGEIRGEIFAYDMDKGLPLLDNTKDLTNMSDWNKLVERVKNMYFTLGLVEGSGDFTKNIGLILMLVGICILGVVMNLILTYTLMNDFASTAGQIGNVTYAVQNYIATHP